MACQDKEALTALFIHLPPPDGRGKAAPDAVVHLIGSGGFPSLGGFLLSSASFVANL